MSDLNPTQRKRARAIEQGLNPPRPILGAIGDAARGVFDTDAAQWQPLDRLNPTIEVRQDIIQRGGGTGRWHVRRRLENGEYESLGRMDAGELEELMASERSATEDQFTNSRGEGSPEPMGQSVLGQVSGEAQAAPENSIVGQIQGEVMQGQQGETEVVTQMMDASTVETMSRQTGGRVMYDRTQGRYVDGQGNPIAFDRRRKVYVVMPKAGE